MPLYEYKCTRCSRHHEEFHHIRDLPDEIECPHCHHSMRRVPSLTNTDLKEFHKPIEMHSIALCHDDEIVAFKRRNPDVDISMDPRDPLYGVPIARTRKQKLDILRKEGWEER